MQQAEDFREESRALAAVLDPLRDADFDQVTLFKGWSIDDVLGHLHMFNVAAEKTLEGDVEFGEFFAPITAGLEAGKSMLEAQFPWLDGLRGRKLFIEWRETSERIADAYAAADPKQRVKWAGPDMSALSSITARQMETWAHGQEVFDVLGVERVEHDRVRNIAHLGVATFAWTYVVRGRDVPKQPPHVRLLAPSGAIWEWNAPQDGAQAAAANRVEGLAVEFAQIVTQTRNFADTDIVTHGEIAREWMAMAQCFAGAPQDPPAVGMRHINRG